MKIAWQGSFASFLCFVLHYLKYWLRIDLDCSEDTPIIWYHCSKCSRTRGTRVTIAEKDIMDCIKRRDGK